MHLYFPSDGTNRTSSRCSVVALYIYPPVLLLLLPTHYWIERQTLKMRHVVKYRPWHRRGRRNLQDGLPQFLHIFWTPWIVIGVLINLPERRETTPPPHAAAPPYGTCCMMRHVVFQSTNILHMRLKKGQIFKGHLNSFLEKRG